MKLLFPLISLLSLVNLFINCYYPIPWTHPLDLLEEVLIEVATGPMV